MYLHMSIYLYVIGVGGRVFGGPGQWVHMVRVWAIGVICVSSFAGLAGGYGVCGEGGPPCHASSPGFFSWAKNTGSEAQCIVGKTL